MCHGKRNTDREDCHFWKERVEKYGHDRTNWPDMCHYPFCSDPKTHVIYMCPSMHARCYSCHVRGHLPDFCDKSMEAKRETFRAHAWRGIFSQRGFTEQELAELRPPLSEKQAKEQRYKKFRFNAQWTFAPPCEPWHLHQVTLANTTYAVDWNISQLFLYKNLPDTAPDGKPSKKLWLDQEDRPLNIFLPVQR